jgi:hypothetical protein
MVHVGYWISNCLLSEALPCPNNSNGTNYIFSDRRRSGDIGWDSGHCCVLQYQHRELSPSLRLQRRCRLTFENIAGWSRGRPSLMFSAIADSGTSSVPEPSYPIAWPIGIGFSHPLAAPRQPPAPRMQHCSRAAISPRVAAPRSRPYVSRGIGAANLMVPKNRSDVRPSLLPELRDERGVYS